MKERLITSLVLVGVLLIVGFIDNKYLTGLLIALIAFVGYREAEKLFGVSEVDIFYMALGVIGLSFFISPLVAAVVGVIFAASYIAYYQKDLSIISPIIYPLLPVMIIYALYLKFGMAYIGWLIVIIAGTDSFAYLIGKNFKGQFFKEGFCPTSPNKSWEGVIGGVVLATILGSLIGMGLVGFFNAFIISFLVSVAGVFGDLFESYLKRKAGVKDSGNLLPGHGGVLDRIDGYLFGAPLMFVLLGV